MAVEGGGIGARLRAGREKLGLTVLQVAERIHTDARIVEAIEAESYEALGAPVYARGHIRHYAELVGESANELIQIYSDSSRVAQPDLTRIVKAPAGPDSSKLVAPALVVIVVFAVAGAIWWVSALSKKKPQMSETHVVTDEATASSVATSGSAPLSAEPSGTTEGTPAAGVSPAGTTVPGTAPGGAMGMQARPGEATGARSGSSAGSAPAPAPRSGGSAGAPGGTTRPAPVAATRTAPAAATPTPPPALASTRTASAAPRPAPAATATASPAASTSAAETAAASRPRNQSQVTLRYSADSWTEVYDSTGARLFYDVGTANSVKTVVGTPPLRVVLGNASGVSVEYNGHSKPIAKLSRPDGSVQFSITRAGEVVRAKPVADGG